MHIKNWKFVASISSLLMHFILYHFNMLDKFEATYLRETQNILFSTSATLIGFIFAVIAILVTITNTPLVQRMIENQMYDDLLEHIRYLIIGFSLTMLCGYLGRYIPQDYLAWNVLITSSIFVYSLIMLITDLFIRLMLIFRNLV